MEIAFAISHEISNPTDGMRKSFAALSTSHKALLFALIEGPSRYIKDVQRAFARLSDGNEQSVGLDGLLEELSHSFIRMAELPWEIREYYDWMHPSVRDLVIDELSLSTSSRRRFLKDGSLGVVRLALSEEGGSTGERVRPLLRNGDDWQELTRTCLKLIGALDGRELRQLFEIFASTRDQKLGDDREAFTRLVSTVCAQAVVRWDADPSVQEVEIYEAIGHLTTRARPLPPMPNAEPLWMSALTEAKDALAQEFDLEMMRALAELLRVVRVIAAFEPRLLLQVGFPDEYNDLMNDLQEAHTKDIPTEPDGYDAYGIIRGAVEELQLGRHVPALAVTCEALLPEYERMLDEIEEIFRESDDDDYEPSREQDHFSDSMIDAVLEDL